MRSYQYIQDLFSNVLQKSKAIGGRFHVSAKGGNEINSDLVGEVLQDVVNPESLRKYPLVLMLPPRSIGNYTDKNGEWERYKIDAFFLTTSHYDGANQVKSLIVNTQTSGHTILQDWHDMQRCAVNFLRVLATIQKDKGLLNNQFRLYQGDKAITPVSNIGIDNASGVRLEFSVSLFIGCTLEDYIDADLSTITLPEADTHPEHNL